MCARTCARCEVARHDCKLLNGELRNAKCNGLNRHPQCSRIQPAPTMLVWDTRQGLAGLVAIPRFSGGSHTGELRGHHPCRDVSRGGRCRRARSLSALMWPWARRKNGFAGSPTRVLHTGAVQLRSIRNGGAARAPCRTCTLSALSLLDVILVRAGCRVGRRFAPGVGV